MPNGRIDLCLLLTEIKNRREKTRRGLEEEFEKIVLTLEESKTNGRNYLQGRFRVRFALGALAQGVIIGVVEEAEYRQAVLCGINL